ncbi:hypothetical protein LMG33810_001210 [Carnimonas sp. LMG 33810]
MTTSQHSESAPVAPDVVVSDDHVRYVREDIASGLLESMRPICIDKEWAIDHIDETMAVGVAMAKAELVLERK